MAIYNAICIFSTLPPLPSWYRSKQLTTARPRLRKESVLLHLEDVYLAGVFQRLSPVAEPHPHHLAVVVELPCDLRDLLARGQGVLLKVCVEDLDGLRREAGAPLAFLGRLSAHELHQILLALLVPELRLRQPALQHRLQLLGTFRRDVQLFESAVSQPRQLG